LIEEVTMPAQTAGTGTFADAMTEASANIWTDEAKEKLKALTIEICDEYSLPHSMANSFYGEAMKRFWKNPEVKANARAAYEAAGVTRPEPPAQDITAVLQESIEKTEAEKAAPTGTVAE
jgi:hypothetical protein